MENPTDSQKRFLVALSFPGEKRDYVQEVSDILCENLGRDKVFYDKNFDAELARPNMVVNLQDIYHDDSVLIVAFLCREYSEKDWCGVELRAILDLIKQKKYSRIMLLKFDQAEIPGIYSIDGYINISKLPAKETAGKILKRLKDKPIVGSIPESPESQNVQDFFSESWPNTDPDIFGREGELRILDEAWENPKINILSLVAFGGVGKTALVNRWKNYNMIPDKWRGALRVYGWSFYSQGAEEGRQASSEMFINHALKWFGDPEMAESKRSASEKGERIANLVREKKTLLLLDGVEPLQEPPNSQTGHPGKMKDQGVAALLKTLARGNPGLCIVTTRIQIEDLNPYAAKGGTVLLHNLDQLTEEAGAEYLKSLGVEGSDKEIKAASREFDGHALALTLLGNFLRIHCEGDIRRRDEVPSLFEEKKKGGHAIRVMKLYEKWLEETPELDILHIMGLFDRPAEKGAVKALLEKPEIKNLTERLQNISDHNWDNSLESLREARLILTGKKEDKSLDAHPLVRDYFGERLKEKSPEAWKEAHGRLYEYYRDLPEKEFPDTIEEMAPFFLSVIHGCKSGRFQEVYDEVYRKRIRRGNECFQVHKLGAFGADLSAISGFFDLPWKNPVKELREDVLSWLLNEAAFDLRALGRLGEAEEPMKAGLENAISNKNWKNVAISSSNLSELSLTLGNIGEAIRYGEECVRYADKRREKIWKMASRTTLADALFQSGDMKKAEELFLEAEEIQKERQPGYPYLYSLQGFKFCDLILSKGDYKEARKRGEQTLEWAFEARGSLLTIAMDHLTLGRAALQSGDMREAGEYLNLAVDGLRKAGTQDHLPQGFLSRSGFFRIKGDFTKAIRDLEEAWEISTRGGMKLWICDIHIESCRFLLSVIKANNLEILKDIAPESPFAAFNDSTDPLKAAKSHIEEASKIIEEIGNHRRDAEILLETAHLQIMEGKKAEAKKTLHSARKTIDESGLHSWDVEYKKLSEKP